MARENSGLYAKIRPIAFALKPYFTARQLMEACTKAGLPITEEQASKACVYWVSRGDLKTMGRLKVSSKQQRELTVYTSVSKQGKLFGAPSPKLVSTEVQPEKVVPFRQRGDLDSAISEFIAALERLLRKALIDPKEGA